MELLTSALSWWKCYWPDSKSAGLFRQNLFLLNSLKTSTLTLSLWPINSGVLTSLLLPHPLIIPHGLPGFLESLMTLKSWWSIYARWSKSSLEYSIRFCGIIFPSLKQHSIAYHSSKVSSGPDCFFEIHHLWQSGFSRVYSNSCL